jgi:hypothetical protein
LATTHDGRVVTAPHKAMIASSRTAASDSFRFQKKSSSPATARSTHLPPSSRASFPRKASARP